MKQLTFIELQCDSRGEGRILLLAKIGHTFACLLFEIPSILINVMLVD